MKKNIKDLNIWNYMHKVSQSEEDKMSEESKLNLLTDGFGNVYLPPNKGATPLCTLDNDDSFLYRYNFETKELEAFVEQKLPDCNNYELVESTGLEIGNFADNPEYWVRDFATKLQDFGYQEAENIVSEDFNLFGDDFTDKELYEYMIRAQVIFNVPDDFNYDELYAVEDKYEKYIESLSQKTSLYTEPLEISCSYSSATEFVYIKCTFTMPMTKEDLMDVWDEYEPLIENSDSAVGYTTEVVDLDMIEV